MTLDELQTRQSNDAFTLRREQLLHLHADGVVTVRVSTPRGGALLELDSAADDDDAEAPDGDDQLAGDQLAWELPTGLAWEEDMRRMLSSLSPSSAYLWFGTRLSAHLLRTVLGESGESGCGRLGE
jgi:hypothetical protein